MDAMAEIRQTFFEECADGLGELEAGLLAIENGTADYETLSTAFRAAHSIKGGAASFTLTKLSTFAHMMEAVLDEVRSKRLETTAEVVALLRRGAGVLADLVVTAREDGKSDGRESREMMDALKPFAGAKGATIAAAAAAGAEIDDGMDDLEFTPVSIDLLGMFGSAFEMQHRISFRPMPELYRNANEASRLIRECLALGSGTVTCDASALPAFEDIDPEGAYLAWTIELTAAADEARIREVFEFVDWDCELFVERIADAEPDIEPCADGASIDAAFAALLAKVQSGEPMAEFREDEEKTPETA